MSSAMQTFRPLLISFLSAWCRLNPVLARTYEKDATSTSMCLCHSIVSRAVPMH